MKYLRLAQSDPEVHKQVTAEDARQRTTLNLIPSENSTSLAVREAESSGLAHKYSEGYPGKRYYQGNKHVDAIEQLAIDRAKELFGAEHANVQPLSGSPANFAVLSALLEPGDTFLGMDLSCGGHLTHGSPVNFSGKLYKAVHYGVDEQTKLIDLKEVERLAKEHQPKVIISGHSAYPRTVDFEAFQQIAKSVGAVHVADMSHLAGLVAAGIHPSPVPHAGIVTTTTHKTLRGPRGALILCKEEYSKLVDKAVFPGTQGGPHNHQIAAKAVAFKEAMSPEFIAYAKRIVENAKALAEKLSDRGLDVVTKGTDNHLVLLDLSSTHGPGLGRKAAVALEQAGIVVNANGVPFDTAPPYKPSGVRLGTPFLTTQGFVAADMEVVADLVADVLKDLDDEDAKEKVKRAVLVLCERIKEE
jgi:glycine hydroxymethyltransferase